MVNPSHPKPEVTTSEREDSASSSKSGLLAQAASALFSAGSAIFRTISAESSFLSDGKGISVQGGNLFRASNLDQLLSRWNDREEQIYVAGKVSIAVRELQALASIISEHPNWNIFLVGSIEALAFFDGAGRLWSGQSAVEPAIRQALGRANSRWNEKGETSEDRSTNILFISFDSQGTPHTVGYIGADDYRCVGLEETGHVAHLLCGTGKSLKNGEPLFEAVSRTVQEIDEKFIERGGHLAAADEWSSAHGMPSAYQTEFRQMPGNIAPALFSAGTDARKEDALKRRRAAGRSRRRNLEDSASALESRYADLERGIGEVNASGLYEGSTRAELDQLFQQVREGAAAASAASSQARQLIAERSGDESVLSKNKRRDERESFPEQLEREHRALFRRLDHQADLLESSFSEIRDLLKGPEERRETVLIQIEDLMMKVTDPRTSKEVAMTAGTLCNRLAHLDFRRLQHDPLGYARELSGLLGEAELAEQRVADELLRFERLHSAIGRAEQNLEQKGRQLDALRRSGSERAPMLQKRLEREYEGYEQVRKQILGIRDDSWLSRYGALMGVLNSITPPENTAGYHAPVTQSSGYRTSML